MPGADRGTREKLPVTGIPVDPLFEKRVDRKEARWRLRLDSEARVVLIAAGVYGLGPVEPLVRDLLALGRPWQMVAMAGKSEKLKKRLEQISPKAWKLAGGSRSALPRKWISTWLQRIYCCGKPVDGPPRKRWRASCPWRLWSRFRARRRAMRIILPAAAWKMAALVECPEKLAAMKRAAAGMARPQAAQVIVEDALGLLN